MRRRVDPAARFRARARAWFAEAPRRLALARLHGWMARLAQAESDALACTFCRAFPGDVGRVCCREHAPRSIHEDLPKHPADLTAEERAQVAHLDDVGAEAFARMLRLAPHRGGLGFHDFLAGDRYDAAAAVGEGS